MSYSFSPQSPTHRSYAGAPGDIPEKRGGGIYTVRMADKTLSGSDEELRLARQIRLAADRKAPMSERLARVHSLCKQMSALKGAARSQ